MMKRLVFGMLALLVAVILTGCVYLRLLEVKNQLADFDRHFRVEVTDRHFVLHLLDPVLLSDDFLELSKLRPSRIESLVPGSMAQGFRWFLDFRIMPQPSDTPVRTIVFAMTFDPRQRLVAWDFSPLFLEMAPPAFLEASIRSLGRGKVDEGRQQLQVRSEDLPKVQVRPPSRKTILEVLGEPTIRWIKDGMPAYLYRFEAQAIPIKPEYAKRRIADAKLYFDPVTDDLVKMSGQFAGLKLAMDYRKLAARPAGQDHREARVE